MSTSARLFAQHMLQYIESDGASDSYLAAATFLLNRVAQQPSVSAVVRASLYRERGYAHLVREEFREAIADFDRAIELELANSTAYLGRGVAHLVREEYREAIADYDRVIELDSANSAAYFNLYYSLT